MNGLGLVIMFALFLGLIIVFLAANGLPIAT